ncbi:MAE_28990/MAE_18760 family HEPN-like nuclease [Bifidobacterium callitrichos]|uniref:MAE_28990/MAE_18760 family HEPN-like nuclease n=1 Tax=Bifidobacterium callitrichos TaxID=762209 RepID=UPI0011B26A57|nr:MAE_28990/MAE_18760 family HEPN-like nuclease [Bifidobacterium callitrichos]
MRKPRIDNIKSNFNYTIDSVRDLVKSTHDNHQIPPDVKKSIRGLAIVMLFGAYEKMIKTLCAELIETASTFRGKQRNLSPQFRMVGIASQINAIRDPAAKKSTLWERTLPNVLKQIDGEASALTEIWPDNGEYMKRSQVLIFCQFFNLGEAIGSLGKVHNIIDSIVSQRNQIAHGELTAQEVGRNYSEVDIDSLINDWENGWSNFLDSVSSIVSNKAYFINSR